MSRINAFYSDGGIGCRYDFTVLADVWEISLHDIMHLHCDWRVQYRRECWKLQENNEILHFVSLAASLRGVST